MFVKHILACAILLAIGRSTSAEYDVAAYCKLVKSGVKLGSVDSCEDYYVCSRGEATRRSCPAGQFYDKNAQTCRPSALVECYYGVAVPCSAKQAGFVPDMASCDGWIYCSNFAEAGRGHCGSGFVFQNGECRYGSCTAASGTRASPGLHSVCDIMPLKVYFGSTLSCAAWQMCTAAGLSTGTCSNKLVYDVNNGLCNYEAAGMCDRVTGQDMQPDGDEERECSRAQNGERLASTAQCSAYFVCQSLRWTKYYCPTGQFFDVPKATCRPRQTATPSASCNRCEGSSKKFVNAVDPACRGYSYCVNSLHAGAGSCDPNAFFNEASQACLPNSSAKAAYVAANGACSASSQPPADVDACDDSDGACGCLDPSNADCRCGVEDSQCVYCRGGVNADGTCAEVVPGSPDDCDSLCGNFGATAAKCRTSGKCQCGIHDGDCVDCRGENCNGCNAQNDECLDTAVCTTRSGQCVHL